MCSIIGTYDLKELEYLAEVNAYRGTISHSIAAVVDNKVVYLDRGENGLEVSNHEKDIPSDAYYIAHQQAPTSAEDNKNTIHPAEYAGRLLWHNGIIKEEQIKKFKEHFKEDINWDTAWLVRLMAQNNPSLLSDVDGGFACMYYSEDGLWVFRNDLVALWHKGSTVSSTRWDHYDTSITYVPSGKIHKLSDNKEWIELEHTFQTKEKYFWSVPL